LGHLFMDAVTGQTAGDLSSPVATHAIGNDPETGGIVQLERILVLAAHAARVGAGHRAAGHFLFLRSLTHRRRSSSACTCPATLLRRPGSKRCSSSSAL